MGTYNNMFDEASKRSYGNGLDLDSTALEMEDQITDAVSVPGFTDACFNNANPEGARAGLGFQKIYEIIHLDKLQSKDAAYVQCSGSKKGLINIDQLPFFSLGMIEDPKERAAFEKKIAVEGGYYGEEALGLLVMVTDQQGAVEFFRLLGPAFVLVPAGGPPSRLGEVELPLPTAQKETPDPYFKAVPVRDGNTQTAVEPAVPLPLEIKCKDS